LEVTICDLQFTIVSFELKKNHATLHSRFKSYPVVAFFCSYFCAVGVLFFSFLPGRREDLNINVLFLSVLPALIFFSSRQKIIFGYSIQYLFVRCIVYSLLLKVLSQLSAPSTRLHPASLPVPDPPGHLLVNLVPVNNLCNRGIHRLPVW
jgi:hypothetical protein